MVNILTGTPFDVPKRLNHRDDEGALEFPSSVGSRVRGLLALKACNWGVAPITKPIVSEAYIETDGNSYMDLGFIPTENLEYRIDFRPYLLPADKVGFIMGASYGRKLIYSIGNAAAGRVDVKATNPTCDKLFDVDGERHVVELSSSGYTVDGVDVATTLGTLPSTRTLVIGQDGRGLSHCIARFYSVKFWESGVLIRDLVPYSGPRGVGLLDKVHDVLYTNAGEGTLTYGQQVWTNPYVTDGLIAMWDAEWNEAGGVHNASLMQLNDVMGNLGPVPVMELGDFWVKRDTGVTFSGSDYPAASGLINSEGYREMTYEGYTSFDPSVQEVTGNRYAFSSNLAFKKANGNSAVKFQAGYGLKADGMCINLRGFFAPIISTVRGDDGVWRTYSCSTLNKSGSDSVAYLDGVEYGRYTWSSGSVFSDVQQIGLGANPAIKDYVKSSCLRIYGRALSADEVAHNARVDRERFGGRL